MSSIWSDRRQCESNIKPEKNQLQLQSLRQGKQRDRENIHPVDLKQYE